MRVRRSLLTTALAALFVLALPLAAQAAGVHVSVLGSDTLGDGSMANPYATVQRGVNAAAFGDDVLVGAGSFSGDVTMKNGVSLTGVGASQTTLQGSGSAPVITVMNLGTGETISGFTITGGFCPTSAWGGGIRCSGSSPTIKDNTITGNLAAWGGGGIGATMSSPLIKNNVITGNVALHGGGVYTSGGAPVIDRNTISNNTIEGAPGQQGYGAGIYMYGGTITNNVIAGNVGTNTGSYGTAGGGIFANQLPIVIANNTIVGNIASPVSGGVYNYFGNPTITNCIIRDNVDDLAAGATATYSNIGNGDAGLGNTSAAPGFVSAGTGDYRLSVGSPCINTATSTAAPADDRDGVYRPQGAAPDMGAYEWFDASTAVVNAPMVSSATHALSTWSNSWAINVKLAGASSNIAPIGGYGVTATTNSTGAPGSTVTQGAEGTVTVSSDGTYYINAAASDVVKNWSGPSYYGPIWIDTQSPSAPALGSSSHALDVGSTNNRITLAMSGSTDGVGSGVAGYSVLWSRTSTAEPSATVNVSTDSTTSPKLLSGTWHALVRAGDKAGNFSGISHRGPFVIEVLAPDDYSGTTAEDTLLSVSAPGLLTGDAAVDDGSLVAKLVSGAAHGDVSVSDDGSFSYMPDANFSGTDTFTFAAYDGYGYSATKTATITVSPAADETEIEITSDWATLAKYDDSYSLTGRLLSSASIQRQPAGGSSAPSFIVRADPLVSNRQVILQSSATATGFADTSVTATTGPDGSFAVSVTPRDMTYYRVRFAGETDVHLPSVSDYVRVLPVAFVSAPTVPAAYAGKSVVAEGALLPRHTAGTKPVRLHLYRYVGGEWKYQSYALATVSDTRSGSKYKATITFPSPGTWKVIAYSLADSKHAPSASDATAVTVLSRGQLAVSTAYQYLGRGFQWGATGPLLFDSSGFTQYVFAKAGIAIPRTAKQQSTAGIAVSRANLQPGDLVFYYSPVSHVGIYIGNGLMIDCNHYGGGVGVRKLYPGYATARRVW